MRGHSARNRLWRFFTVSISNLNAFCRKYDLIFVEMGRVRGDEVYWFIDFTNQRCFYTAGEIENKLTV